MTKFFKEDTACIDGKIDMLIKLQQDRINLERERLNFECERAGLPPMCTDGNYFMAI